MLNTCVIVGRVIRKPKLQTINDKTEFYMLIETNRPFRMEDGTLKKDVFNVRLWRGLAAECSDLCQEGDVIAIKGRMETMIRKNGEFDEYICQIVAEKLTYIEVAGKRSGIMF